MNHITSVAVAEFRQREIGCAVSVAVTEADKVPLRANAGRGHARHAGAVHEPDAERPGRDGAPEHIRLAICIDVAAADEVSQPGPTLNTAVPATARPFMNQISNALVVAESQKMSARPSPFTSPSPAKIQSAGAPNTAEFAIAPAFMSQMPKSPSVAWRQRMSAVPWPSKSGNWPSKASNR